MTTPRGTTTFVATIKETPRADPIDPTGDRGEPKIDTGKGNDVDQGGVDYPMKKEWYHGNNDKKERGEDCISIVMVFRVVCGILGVIILVLVAVFVIYEEKKKTRAVGAAAEKGRRRGGEEGLVGVRRKGRRGRGGRKSE